MLITNLSRLAVQRNAKFYGSNPLSDLPIYYIKTKAPFKGLLFYLRTTVNLVQNSNMIVGNFYFATQALKKLSTFSSS
jgi:hypothetical protein